MVYLVKGRDNKIQVSVTSTIDCSGFSAVLDVAGIQKDISNLKSRSISVLFPADEIECFGTNLLAYLYVYDKSGKLYIKNLVSMGTCETEDRARGKQKISIVLVSIREARSTSKEEEEFIEKKVEEAVDKAMDESISEKVVEVVDDIIDEKVEECVTGIVEQEVEKEVDRVIDVKVEEQVNALFDDSDSDTIGGQFNEMKETVIVTEDRVDDIEKTINEDIKPRLESAEEDIAKKVDLDYDDSDDMIHFFREKNLLEDSDET